MLAALALTLALTGAHGQCPADYVVRGVRYEVCADGLWASVPDNDRLSYRLPLSTWLRSQVDTTMGDDERLGA